MGASSSVLQRPLLVKLLLAAMTAVMTVYLGLVLFNTIPERSDTLAHWLTDGVIAAAAVVCGVRGAKVEYERSAWVAMTVALFVYLLGDLYWNTAMSGLDDPPYPSWADLGWLLFYLPAYAAIALLLRERMGKVQLGEWLDGLIGTLAVAAIVAATLLGPVLDQSGSNYAETFTNLAYPVGDLVLIVFTASALVYAGTRPGPGWLSLSVGLMIFAASDVSYLLASADNTYIEGGFTDAGWPLASLLIALAAWQPMTPAQPRKAHSITEQITVTGFAMGALTVLILGLMTDVGTVARGFGIAAMGVTVLRLALAAHESRTAEERRARQAQTDDLTGLMNRRGFYRELGEQLPVLLSSDATSALLLMDLNHFKELNDSLGHAAGDELLRTVADRLETNLPPGALLARIGGDEFVVLLTGLSDPSLADTLTRATLDAVARPAYVGGVLCHTAASVGVALIPDHGREVSTLLRRADIAMYRAKQNGTGVEIFDEQLEQLSRDHIELAGELQRGIEHDELVLYYQPKANLRDGSVECLEALVRWDHPQHGLLAPGDFLPFAERYGLMRQVTRAVLTTALAQQQSWRERDGIDVAIAVNLSSADLIDESLPGEVATLMKRHSTPRGKLQFEITENTVMVDPERVLHSLRQIGDFHITFALDDFGTGRASLAYLKRLPVSELKIDRSFVAEMTSDHSDAVIVQSTITLAHNLGMRVVAEGVETAEHWRLLTAQGCDTAQGFYLSRPLPADDVAPWLRKRAGNDEAAA